jgi:uncharacterized protein YuzB (UPF0349 family)
MRTLSSLTGKDIRIVRHTTIDTCGKCNNNGREITNEDIGDGEVGLRYTPNIFHFMEISVARHVVGLSEIQQPYRYRTG